MRRLRLDSIAVPVFAVWLNLTNIRMNTRRGALSNWNLLCICLSSLILGHSLLLFLCTTLKNIFKTKSLILCGDLVSLAFCTDCDWRSLFQASVADKVDVKNHLTFRFSHLLTLFRDLWQEKLNSSDSAILYKPKSNIVLSQHINIAYSIQFV